MDANARAVFGDDKASVPIYYESCTSKLSLNTTELPKLDVEFEEITKARS